MEFDDGARKKDGKGKYTFINGESYFGEWKDSKFNGFGKYTTLGSLVIELTSIYL